MCSAAEGGLSVARSARPGDTSDKAAVRIQVAVRTTPDASCYDAKDHTTMAARGEGDKAEDQWRCGNCAHACSILAQGTRRTPISNIRTLPRSPRVSLRSSMHSPSIIRGRPLARGGRDLCSVQCCYRTENSLTIFSSV